MSLIDRLIEPIRHSPQLPQAIAILQAELEAERQRRDQFYLDMTPDQKIEFIDGEIVLHSPARNRHLDVTGCIFKLLQTYVVLHRLGQVKSEKCLCVFPRNDYEPDVVFFGPVKSASLCPDTMKFPVPDMAVEVLSQSTRDRDRGVKFEDFASNCVEEYWIVDSDTQIDRRLHLPEYAPVAASLQEIGFNSALDLFSTYAGRASDLKPFLQGGKRCARLITTRNSEVLPSDAQKINVDATNPAEVSSVKSLSGS